MSNVNDEKILELKAQIKEKKKKLSKIKKFTPITNCSIEVDGARYNLQVLGKEQLMTLMIRLNSYRLSALNLEVLDDYVISGFKVDDWISDIKARYNILTQRDEESKLQDLENKLHTLLSSDKKVELEISEIEKLIN